MRYFKEEDLPQVQKYLSNRLEGKEKARFEQRLQQDSNLQQELEWYRAMFSALEETEDQRRKALLQASLKNNAAEPAMPKSANWNKWVAAAGFLLVVVAGILIWSRSETSLFTAHELASYDISDDLIRTRSGSDSDTDRQAVRRAAVQEARLFDSLYTAGNYQQALSLLEEMPSSATILFYRANCLLALDRPAEAIPILKEVETYTQETFSNFAQWYLALAYYQNGEPALAREYAIKTINNEGIYKENRAKARELLNLLEND